MDAGPVERRDACCFAEAIAIRSGCVDIVLATEVLEHVDDAVAAMKELFRVLRPGGYAVITVPFMYPTHEVPYDFRRFTYLGIQNIAAQAGFEIIDVSAKGGPIALTVHLGMMLSMRLLSRSLGRYDGSWIGCGVRVCVAAGLERIAAGRFPSPRMGSGAREASLGYMLLGRKPDRGKPVIML
jgi:SAM-dependent methyltransferase